MVTDKETDVLLKAFEALLDGLKMSADISKQQHDLNMKRFDKIDLMLELLISDKKLMDAMSEPH